MFGKMAPTPAAENSSNLLKQPDLYCAADMATSLELFRPELLVDIGWIGSETAL